VTSVTKDELRSWLCRSICRSDVFALERQLERTSQSVGGSPKLDQLFEKIEGVRDSKLEAEFRSHGNIDA